MHNYSLGIVYMCNKRWKCFSNTKLSKSLKVMHIQRNNSLEINSHLNDSQPLIVKCVELSGVNLCYTFSG